MSRLLILSNGHGEDLSGAMLGRSLLQFGHRVDALPLVGQGCPYTDLGIPLLLNGTRVFSTGGLGYTSWRGRLTEILQGQALYLLRNLVYLLSYASYYDLVVVVGDVVPVTAAWLCRRPTAVYLVAYSSYYEGRLRLPWPCRNCLTTRHVLAVFSRDALTAEDLSGQLSCPVTFLGNPFMDPVWQSQPPLPQQWRLGLLPGSRQPELKNNLELLMRVVEHLPESLLASGKLAVDIALVASLTDKDLSQLGAARGWRLEDCFYTGEAIHKLCWGRHRVNVRRGQFAALLQGSDLLLSMAGTATEQAVGLGRPVLQLPGLGPQFTSKFAEAQRRLLGPGVFCAVGDAGSPKLLAATARLALDLLERSVFDVQFQQSCRKEAVQRLGPPGGSSRIARAINQLLRTN
ncbi:lipid A disaccharide synthetase related enzyme [cyanobiont of Ornithocercus magnificus]|nr:lipid A disaccharide synthetase related enzyme [cyanobiont of Ornithocercus magnificus]